MQIVGLYGDAEFGFGPTAIVEYKVYVLILQQPPQLISNTA